jgi:enoyl-CoA hydratase/carnithine racemase
MGRIATLQLSPGGFADLFGSPRIDDLLTADDPLRLILLDGADRDDELPRPGSLPVIIAALDSTAAGPGPSTADLTVDPAGADALADAIAANPIAATSFVLLLRAAEEVPVDTALALESATYSMLQAGGEFAAWRALRAEEPPARDDESTVLVDRDGEHLTITLNRPRRHNAITAQLRDDLCEALDVALHDRSVRVVTLTGAGPSFCSGGDLAEFGARADPAAAHLIRLTRSPARQLHRLAARLGPGLHARIHGHTLGGGIEMAAFCRRVTAAPGTTCGLPEVGLGLIPGAGGTVSLTRRIGRQRTAWLGLTGQHIDPATAHAWGLVDSLDG